MPRAKSPARSRSKSPGPVDLDMSSDMAQLAVAAVAIGVCTFMTKGDDGLDLGDAKNFLTDTSSKNIHLPGGLSFNLFALGHAVNVINNNNNGGYWFNSLCGALFAAYGGMYAVNAFTNGLGNTGCFADNWPFALMWYFMNQDYFGLWGKVKGFGGAALSNLLSLCSLVFITDLVCTTAAAQNNLFSALALGTIAGTAGNFWPLNKGIKFSRDSDHDHAFACSVFVAGGVSILFTAVNEVLSLTNGVIPSITDHGADLTQKLLGFTGCNESEFVVVATVLIYLIAPVNPLKDVTGELKSGFDCFGLVDKVQNLLNL